MRGRCPRAPSRGEIAPAPRRNARYARLPAVRRAPERVFGALGARVAGQSQMKRPNVDITGWLLYAGFVLIGYMAGGLDAGIAVVVFLEMTRAASWLSLKIFTPSYPTSGANVLRMVICIIVAELATFFLYPLFPTHW